MFESMRAEYFAGMILMGNPKMPAKEVVRRAHDVCKELEDYYRKEDELRTRGKKDYKNALARSKKYQKLVKEADELESGVAPSDKRYDDWLKKRQNARTARDAEKENIKKRLLRKYPSLKSYHP